MDNRRKLLEDFCARAKIIIRFLQDIGDEGTDNWWEEITTDSHRLSRLYEELWRPNGIDPPEVPPLVIHFFTNLKKMNPKPSYVEKEFPNDKAFWLLFMQHPEGLSRKRYVTLSRDGLRRAPRNDRGLRKSIVKCLEEWVTFAGEDIARLSSPKIDDSPPNAKPDPKADDETDAASKPRGRKKADYETVRREAELAANWVRSRDSGVYKADFTKEQGMQVKEFDRLLDRVAKRKNSSE